MVNLDSFMSFCTMFLYVIWGWYVHQQIIVISSQNQWTKKFLMTIFRQNSHSDFDVTGSVLQQSGLRAVKTRQSVVWRRRLLSNNQSLAGASWLLFCTIYGAAAESQIQQTDTGTPRLVQFLDVSLIWNNHSDFDVTGSVLQQSGLRAVKTRQSVVRRRRLLSNNQSHAGALWYQIAKIRQK